MSNEADTIYREGWHLPIVYAFSVVMILGLHSIYYPLHVAYASGIPKHITIAANAYSSSDIDRGFLANSIGTLPRMLTSFCEMILK